METKRLVAIALICSLIGIVHARTITEMEKNITSLNNEYIKLQKNPIVIFGGKQENVDDVRKRATSAYNINLAQGKERSAYKTKVVITINPIYVCPIHKCFFINDNCEKAVNCKAKTNIGTKNFAGRGADWDLSYRCWKALKDEIPAGVEQEKRLKEIEDEIAGIRAEIKAEQDAQQAERIAKKEAARAQQIENGKKKGVKGKKNGQKSSVK